ncbi:MULTISPECIES: iron chaperone [unclassified Ornithinimicrobium]|uniref:iron chaperone n=1 Tax=unclassified Ornithinimicrobium TaxID=2615080 RepID=UPI00385209F4
MGQSTTTLSAAEKKAIKERAAELRASQKKEKLEQAVLEKIAEMPEDEQKLARQVHEIVTDVAPDLTAKTWYGMPAYADANGKIVVFFQAASKFDARYSTIGFDEAAHLDEGSMWPVSWALTTLGDTDAQMVRELVRKAVGSA